ncbi:hypothetical protein L0657_24290 [Dyadobacter sp. CY345]|uniref:hypothetical protein n=1 Tax=Dyadobacter sp. CY345 TaxID=2909335 RepID=UPI001F3A3813|nr:hypothetical protein [Dyadobacter sp. CY345]MCF2447096.1 hypothetical protein [Dyadobacter sp. CY345]
MKLEQYILTFFLFWTAMVLCTPGFAQKKYEREYSIKSNEVPQQALKLVSSIFPKSRIHWYREESLTGNSIEAKLKSSGKRFSIEFDETGNLQDVEIMSNISEMSSEGRKVLKEELSKSFEKYRIEKVQLQWVGQESKIKKSLLELTATDGIRTRYELIIKGTRDGKENYFEILSESDGRIVTTREIVQRNTDNLIY